MRYFILNTKNYPDISGERFDALSKIFEGLAEEEEYRFGIEFFLSVPAFTISHTTQKYSKIRVLAQHVDDAEMGATTGFLVPQMARSFGARGSLINHSEHRLPIDQIQNIVKKLREMNLISIVCARDDVEVRRFSEFSPDFIAIEPPELIGTGVAVSKARPELIRDSRKMLESSKPRDSFTKLICGAGIVDGNDARSAVELGAEGILVASGVIKAADWRGKISELASGIISAKEKRQY